MTYDIVNNFLLVIFFTSGAQKWEKTIYYVLKRNFYQDLFKAWCPNA